MANNGPKQVVIWGASPLGRHRYVGSQGKLLGMKTFGMSAPIKVVSEHVVAAAKEVLGRAGS